MISLDLARIERMTTRAEFVDYLAKRLEMRGESESRLRAELVVARMELTRDGE